MSELADPVSWGSYLSSESKHLLEIVGSEMTFLSILSDAGNGTLPDEHVDT